MKFFSEFAMQDYYYQQFSPSELAMAIIVTARKSLHFNEIWRKEFIKLSGYNEDIILPIYEHLWRQYLDNYPSKDNKSLQSSPDDVRQI